MSFTDAIGYMGIGKMHVLSHNQVNILLKDYLPSSSSRSLLDIGAGSGEVTQKLSSLFSNIITTEVSFQMAKALQNKGYQSIVTDQISKIPWLYNQQFDCVSCLNVLDRCDEPITLLNEIKHVLKPTGVLLLAVVLPFSTFVENGTQQKEPSQLLEVEGETFIESACSLARNVLIPMGFSIKAFTSVPYLSQGDPRKDLYVLGDAVFVLGIDQVSL